MAYQINTMLDKGLSKEYKVEWVSFPGGTN